MPIAVLPLTTYGSVCAPAAGNIPGVLHSYTAGIGRQYGARMATAARTGSFHPRFATDVQQALNYVFTP
jgi:hypothetical protein